MHTHMHARRFEVCPFDATMNALTPSISISVGRMWCVLLWSLGEKERQSDWERLENTRGHDRRRASKTFLIIHFPSVSRCQVIFPSYFSCDAPLLTMPSNHDIRPPDMRCDVQEIFRSTPHHKQVMMFSATLSKEIRVTCKKFMANVSHPCFTLVKPVSQLYPPTAPRNLC